MAIELVCQMSSLLEYSPHCIASAAHGHRLLLLPFKDSKLSNLALVDERCS